MNGKEYLKPKPINSSGIIWEKSVIFKKAEVVISTLSAFKKFSKKNVGIRVN